jgi:hypothetical protein
MLHLASVVKQNSTPSEENIGLNNKNHLGNRNYSLQPHSKHADSSAHGYFLKFICKWNEIFQIFILKYFIKKGQLVCRGCLRFPWWWRIILWHFQIWHRLVWWVKGDIYSSKTSVLSTTLQDTITETFPLSVWGWLSPPCNLQSNISITVVRTFEAT